MIQLLFAVFLMICSAPSSSKAENENIKKADPVTKPSAEKLAAEDAIQKVAKGRDITLRDFGSDDLGFISLPMEAPQYGVLIISDSSGLSDQVKSFCDMLASQKAIALAVDLFNGKVAATPDEAAEMQKELRPDSARRIVAAALSLLTESPRLHTDKVVIAAFGKQFNLILDPDKKVEQKIVGATWFEPEGKFEAKLFRNSNLPIQIISTKASPNQADFLKELEKNIIPERKKITFIELHNSPIEFILSDKSTADQVSAKTQAVNFWKKCAQGAFLKERNIFQKFIDSIVD